MMCSIIRFMMPSIVLFMSVMYSIILFMHRMFMFMMFTMVMFMYMVFSIIMFMYTTVCSLKDALSHLVHDLDVLQYHVHDALSWCSQLYSWTHCFPSSCTGTAVSGNNNLVLMYGYSLATSIDLLTVAYRDLTLWTLGSDLY